MSHQFEFNRNYPIFHTGSTKVVPLYDDVLMNIIQINSSIATVDFTTFAKVKIVDKRIRLFDNTNNVEVNPISVNTFVICYTDDYTFILDKVSVIFKSKKAWDFQIHEKCGLVGGDKLEATNN